MPGAQSRLAKLQSQLAPDLVLLLTDPADLRYFASLPTLLPGENEALLLVTATHARVVQNSFSPLAQNTAIEIKTGFRPKTAGESVRQFLSDIDSAKNTPNRQIQLDYAATLHTTAQSILDACNALACTLKPLDRSPIWKLRMIKDEHERAHSRTAAQITAQTMRHAQSLLKTGITERELQFEIDAALRTHRADNAFPTIVAFGAHAALPHHQPTDTALIEESCVLIDMGARVRGYCADMTRTVWFGQTPSATFSQIETAVMTAYDTALRAVQNGASADAVDGAARSSIRRAGFADHFIHTTGHGVGLTIHEPPSLNSQNTTPLAAGMLLTIEPGIYLEGECGYRHENTVLVQSNPDTPADILTQ